MSQLLTMHKRRPFSFEPDGDGGYYIEFGNGYPARITATHLQRLRATFKGQTLPLGTSRDNPSEDSLGYWLQANVTKTAIASYLGPLLVHERLASWAPQNGKALMIKIL